MKNILTNIPALFIILLFGNCFMERRIVGTGKYNIEERTIAQPFNKICIAWAARLHLRQSDTVKVTVRDYENLLPHLKTTVEDETLVIDYDDMRVMEWEGAEITIQVPMLSSIIVQGKSTIKTIDTFQFDDLKINVSGVATIDLKGSAKRLDADLSGISYLFTFGLKCDTAHITFSGIGRAEVFPIQMLCAEVSGIGKVLYKGVPSVKKSSISGIGSIKAL